jgi:hypothetical protein
VTATLVERGPDGVMAVQVVGLLQLTRVAALVPNAKVVAPATVEKPAPVIVTVVPPEGGPAVGLIAVNAGMYVNETALEEVPLTLAVTLTGPPTPGGETTVQAAALVQVALTWLAPNLTTVATPLAESPLPWMVTVVPPAAGPEVGLMELITGPGGGGAVPKVRRATKVAHSQLVLLAPAYSPATQTSDGLDGSRAAPE